MPQHLLAPVRAKANHTGFWSLSQKLQFQWSHPCNLSLCPPVTLMQNAYHGSCRRLEPNFCFPHLPPSPDMCKRLCLSSGYWSCPCYPGLSVLLHSAARSFLAHAVRPVQRAAQQAGSRSHRSAWAQTLHSCHSTALPPARSDRITGMSRKKGIPQSYYGRGHVGTPARVLERCQRASFRRERE